MPPVAKYTKARDDLFIERSNLYKAMINLVNYEQKELVNSRIKTLEYSDTLSRLNCGLTSVSRAIEKSENVMKIRFMLYICEFFLNRLKELVRESAAEGGK